MAQCSCACTCRLLKTASDAGESSGYLSLVIFSSLLRFTAHKHFPAPTTIGELEVHVCRHINKHTNSCFSALHVPYMCRGRLELITGAMVPLLPLQLYDSDEGKLVCELQMMRPCWGPQGAEDAWRINVMDKD